ncbi:MAG: YwmB family TATA-box binding protein, partial [Butyrivibrio sp.]|nr:YwmB family TATA-box binding protein [Butyrivibrio sp.]
MKKITLAAAMLLWAVMATRIIAYGLGTADDIVSAFNSMDYDNSESVIEAFGDYGSMYLSEEEKAKLLSGIAACLGISGGYDISTSDSGEASVTSLYKNSLNAEVTIKVATVTRDGGLYKTCEQSVAVNMRLKGRTDCAVTYKNMVSDVFEANGIKGYVNLNLKGELPGALNYYERNKAADALLKKLNAEIVAENRDNDIFTVYAYTEEIEEYITSAGRRVNINIAE